MYHKNKMYLKFSRPLVNLDNLETNSGKNSETMTYIHGSAEV